MTQTTVSTAPAAAPTAAELARIILQQQQTPGITEMAIDFQPFPIAKAKAAKQIVVELWSKTKTRYYIAVRHGNKVETLYLKPSGCEGLKYHEQPMRNGRTGERFNYYYFVASKKQGVAVLENYIKHVVYQYLQLHDEYLEVNAEPFTVIFWTGRTYREFIAAVS